MGQYRLLRMNKDLYIWRVIEKHESKKVIIVSLSKAKDINSVQFSQV